MPPINQTAGVNAVAPCACLVNLTADPSEHGDIAAARPAAVPFQLTGGPSGHVGLGAGAPGLAGSMMADFLGLNGTSPPPWIVPPSELPALCAVALENDNVAAPWRTAPLPQDM